MGEVLESRGWVRNVDFHSICFDLKLSSQLKHVTVKGLLPDQKVNHFKGTKCLIAKSGLCKTLKNLVWFNNVDIDTFFPRTFYLNSSEDYHDFVEQYKLQKTVSVLKELAARVENGKPMDELFTLKAQIALAVNLKRSKDVNELITEVFPPQ